MAAKSHPESSVILARQVPQAIRFLTKDLKVRATVLADIFGESADTIRHTARRAKALPPGPPVLAIPEDDLSFLNYTARRRELERRLNLRGIRLRTKVDCNRAEKSIWAIFRAHQSIGMTEGYEAFLAMRPSFANAQHDRALAIGLLLEEKLGWFALSLGMIQKALVHSEAAMKMARDAFHESAGQKDYLLRYGEAALVASICLQKLHRPERAFDFIRAADTANRAVGQKPGSEHLRQRGASFIQMGPLYDQLAERQFKRAPQRMLRKNEAGHDVDLGMSGLRQRAFLNPGSRYDSALELAEAVKNVYGESSMQYAVAAKSAAVAGFKYGSAESTATGLKLLDEISPGFPEKPPKGVRHILSITPELKLSPADLDRWLRFAMNESPLPHK